jgi:hypothetical protein
MVASRCLVPSQHDRVALTGSRNPAGGTSNRCAANRFSIKNLKMKRPVLSILLINAGNVFFALGIFSLTRAFQMFEINAYFWLAFGTTLVSLLLGTVSVQFGTRWLGLEQ